MFHYLLIGEGVVAMVVVNGSERVGGDYPSLSPSEGRGVQTGQAQNNQYMPIMLCKQKCTIITTVLVLAR